MNEFYSILGLPVIDLSKDFYYCPRCYYPEVQTIIKDISGQSALYWWHFCPTCGLSRKDIRG